MESGTFYTTNSYTWMNRLIHALKTAVAFPIILILIIAPQADDPGVMVMLTAITLFIFTIFIVSSLLRDQVQSKTTP